MALGKLNDTADVSLIKRWCDEKVLDKGTGSELNTGNLTFGHLSQPSLVEKTPCAFPLFAIIISSIHAFMTISQNP